MTFTLSNLNGVTFGANTFANTDVTSPATYGYNAAGGFTDVSGTLPSSVEVEYFTGVVTNSVRVTGAVQYSSGDGHYIAPSSTNFGTFGYINIKFGASPTAHKYFVHGFSQHALLTSSYATLTMDQFNGLDASYTDTYGHTFEILNNYSATLGSTSPIYQQTPVDYVATGSKITYIYDNAGIKHGVYFWSDGSGVHTDPAAGSRNVIVGTNAHPPTFPLTFTQTIATYAGPPCFAQGARIATPRGEVDVEALAVGDEVLTASGARRPVTWVGRRRVRPARHAAPEEVQPILIRAGAFGEGQPRRDLRLSPGHAVYMEGALIPAGRLVNGATIVQEAVEAVRYFHVELDAHDVLLAEGLPCESYLDDGNRESFANAGQHLALHGRLDPVSWENACAPMIADGPQLAAARAALVARAEELGWRRVEEPGLKLVAGGVTLEPVRELGLRAWFLAPAGQGIRLASNHAVLGQVAPEFDDARRLGVAVSEIRVDGEPLPLASPAFGQGFYPVEAHAGRAWRWTDGDAQLALELPEGALVEVGLIMAAPSWRRPAAALRLVEQR